MNTAEKLAATYLRLNGFFLLPHFTVLDGPQHNHVDLLGYRPGGSSEMVLGQTLPRDEWLNDMLGRALGYNSTTSPVGIICEVRSNKTRDEISPSHVRYTRSLLGNLDPARIIFCQADAASRRDEVCLLVPLRHAYTWIQHRITVMERSWENNRASLSKTGSWVLSDDFLSDILSLRRILGEEGESARHGDSDLWSR